MRSGRIEHLHTTGSVRPLALGRERGEWGQSNLLLLAVARAAEQSEKRISERNKGGKLFFPSLAYSKQNIMVCREVRTHLSVPLLIAKKRTTPPHKVARKPGKQRQGQKRLISKPAVA